MRMRNLGAILAAASVLGAGALTAGERGDRHDRGGHPMHHGMHHGAMLDFDAVAGADADSVDREQLESWGVERLGEFDTDGNGALDREEIAATLPEIPRSPLMVFAGDPTEARVDRILAMLEAEEAGEVTLEAMAARQVDFLMRALDRDEDGVITREEAEAGPAWDRGKRRDRDGDRGDRRERRRD